MLRSSRAPFVAALALVWVTASPSPGARKPTPLEPQLYLEHVKTLASPEMRGRGTGSPELEKAARYIAKQFRETGVRPIEGKDYRLPFSVTTNATPGEENRFSWTLGVQGGDLKFREDFVPFNFSSSGQLRAPVVFAGYGITAREYSYDDYDGVDAQGKIVLLLRHEPQEFDESSVFSGKVYTEHAQFFSKVTNAKNHGAVGVILINDRPNHRGEPDDLESFGKTVGPANAGIPFVQIKADVAEQWISASGRSLDEIHAGIDRDLKPASFPLPETLEVRLQVDVERAVKTVHNVAAYVPGETDEYIIIGAHYDHLGLGEQFSMAPALAGTPHPGADDNASGTAGLIELARYFASQPKPKRGVLFLAFAGEELGLLGSSHYVNHPRLPLGRCVAMINMDMIGRIREGRVFIGGSGTGSTLKEVLNEAIPRSPLKVDLSDTTGYGSSDHTSFTTKEVPVLFFFSGLHGDYHKPSDTWDKVDAASAVELLKLVADISGRLIEREDRPQFVRVRETPNVHAGSAAGVPSGSGYGAYFGSIPDFAEVPKGVRFADVREGSPAEKAGLRRGDVLVEFAGKPIQNLYDFTYALRTHQPGEEVSVKVLRDGGTVEARVLLAKRTK